jgi:aromatic ring-opening dioxygenase catalytic subunit (LigB family)
MAWNPPDTWNKMAAWLAQVGDLVGVVPKAAVVVSGHWEEKEFTVTSRPHPPLFYDYYGFPEHTYRLEYNAPGSPALARQIHELLRGAGITAESESERGFDHGVFIPFKLIYPNADIPIVQLSLKKGLDPAAHIGVGRALEPLRHQKVLIVGSGMSYHNMKSFGRGGAVSDQFDAWLTEAVCASNPKVRNEKLRQWSAAPGGREAHPREDHLLPLMVVAGAAGADLGKKVFTDRVMNATVSAFQFGKSLQ